MRACVWGGGEGEDRLTWPKGRLSLYTLTMNNRILLYVYLSKDVHIFSVLKAVLPFCFTCVCF